VGSSHVDSASLDPSETNQQTLPPVVKAVWRGDAAEHWRIVRALQGVPDAPWRGRCSRMLGCSVSPLVGLTGAGAVGAVWFRCRDRLCPRCSRCRARESEGRIMAAIADADSLRFVTLTMQHTDKPLWEQVDALYTAFRELRRRVSWRTRVTGGVATVEVTRNASTGRWHPHLHVLITGSYYPQRDLADEWFDVTGHSRVVDIRAVHSRRHASRYVAKYAGKPADLANWPADAIAEYAAAMHRRRMVLTFGCLHGRRVDTDDEPERRAVRSHRVPLERVEARARGGCSRARDVLAALAAQSHTYARSIEARGMDAPPIARLNAETMRRSRASMRWLTAAWRDGRSDVWWGVARAEPRVRPPEPEPQPPPRPKMRDHTQPLSDWHVPETRKV